MKKQKFTITKHNRANGTSYYTCTVAVENLRRPKNLIELFIYGSKGVPYVVERKLGEKGRIYNNISPEFYEKNEVLLSIEKYIENRERIEGEKVVSTEIEVIYK